ncbi:type VI secretion protein [Paraburkholderia sp. Cy-641]|uniref:VirB3 family type IV secretion system protein n=1 Tax=Paraburkholderia sp. Cy-641 TaxID=2608337 RepID=UPI001F039D16|nr:VirB3 family type IV secretion system protein [Paraburkholderia sp. Cy-641]NIF78119.1 type VI secretion protein [Paraburkholderia sp. Cy-641]
MESLRSDSRDASGEPVDSPDPLAARIRKTMLEPFLLLGIDRKWCIAQGAIVITFAAGLRNGWVLLAVLLTHPVLWLAARRDPDQIRCYVKYSRQGDYYEPRQLLRQKINARPKGFARGIPC